MVGMVARPRKEQKSRLKKEKPTIKQSLALEKSKPQGMRNQKTVHTIRGRGWVAECTDELPDHDKRMSNGQALDVHRTRARTRHRYHQPVPSQYRSGGLWVRGKRGYSLAMGRRKSLFWGSYLDSFGVMSCWDDLPPKRSMDKLEPLGACYEG